MKNLPEDARPETLAIHHGVYKDEQWNSVTTPIYASSTFAFSDLDTPPPFDYTRSGNPTRQALNDNLAALEGGHSAYATSSGMSAIATVLHLLEAGDHLITGCEVYGGSYRLLSQVAPKMGIEVSFVDMLKPEEILAAIKKETRMIWLESPTNPLLNIVDLEAVSAIAKEHGLLTGIDKTFMTPLRQRPFEFGIDISVHSTTKYINGHSDCLGGVVVCREKEIGERVGWLVNALGTGQSPYDAWLVLRGVKTLPARIAAHESNARALAFFLDQHEHVRKVYYPGLPNHPGFEIATRQQSGFGGMLSFEIDDEKVDIKRFFKALHYYSLCVSLGGVESLIEQPWSMSHLAMPEEARIAAGITPGLVRISAGIEHPTDLTEDLKQALAAALK